MERARESPRVRASWFAPALLIVGVTVAATAPILIRYADTAEPLAISFWRCAAGAILLLPFARRDLRGLSKNHVKLTTAAGVFLALHFATWITSLELTAVAPSVLLVSTTPIFVALIAPRVVHERLTRNGWIGIVLAFAGTAIIVVLDSGAGKFEGSSLGGNALALAGGATAGGYVLAGRLARRDLGILPYAVATYGVAAVGLLIACLIGSVPMWGYDGQTWLAIAALVLGPQLMGHTLINYALSDIDATTVAISFMSEPVIATVLAALLFDEIPGFVFYPAAVAILAGIFIVSTNQRPVEVAPT
jgi:drug/metabolite transporter (DMT)-like permease